jgi:DDE superfamily endonuclease
VARNRGKNTTLLSGMSLSGMGPSMVVKGGAEGALLEGYRQRVRELVEGAGAEVLYLPPYSPDFNPIEEAFWKIKNLIGKAWGACTKPSSWRSVRRSARSARRTRRHSSSIAATVRRFNYYDRRCRFNVNGGSSDERAR